MPNEIYEGDTVTISITLKTKDAGGEYTVPLTNAQEVRILITKPDGTTLPERLLSNGTVTNATGGKYTTSVNLPDEVTGKFTASVRATSPANQIINKQLNFYADPLAD